MKPRSALAAFSTLAVILTSCTARNVRVDDPQSAAPAAQSAKIAGAQPVAAVQPTAVPLVKPADQSAPPADAAPDAAGEVVARRTADSATYDLGDGRYELVQDAQPMHYQDEQGAWQRIDPAFALAEGGWINATNALRTHVAAQSSVARISLGSLGIGWEPRGLYAAGAGDQASEIAAPRATPAVTATLSGDRRTVSYPSAWSDGELQDAWQSGFGSAEYTLRLASLPQTAGTPDSLELRVTLHPAPGTRIEVDGKVIDKASLPVQVNGALAFVSAAGERLWLQAPSAYEQGDLSARVMGSYSLAADASGADAAALELRVRVPWSWLADPARTFPVLLDPLFQVTSSTVASEAHYNDYGTFTGLGTPNPLELGQYYGAVIRLLVKFPLPSLPPGATINQARLIAVPSHINWPTRTYLATNVQAYPLSDDVWTSNASLAPNYNAAASLGTVGMSYSAGQDTPASTWDVTSLVNTWWTTLGSNHGILLKITNEFCASGNRNKWPEDCGGFYFDNPSTFADTDVQYTENNPLGTTPTSNNGLRLAVIYNAQPLSEGQVIAGIMGGVSNPDGEKPYYHADHEYHLSNLPYHWQAVVARGLGSIYGTLPTSNTKTDVLWRTLSGIVNLELRDDSNNVLHTKDAKDNHLSYVVMDGYDETAGASNRPRVKPLAGDNQPNGYDIRLIAQKESINVAINSSETRDYIPAYSGVFPSGHWENGYDTDTPLEIWNVQVPDGANTRIDVSILNDNSEYVAGEYDNAREFSAQLYSANSSPDTWYLGTERQYRKLESNAAPSGSLSEGSVRLSSGIFTAGSDRLGLALAYNGPAVTMWTRLYGSGEFKYFNVAPLRFSYRVRVTACGTGMFPTKNGTCQQIKCPTASFNPADRRTDTDMQMWSENSWSGNTTNATTIAPLIGPTGDNAPTVAIVGGQISYDGSGHISVNADSNVLLVDCGTLGSPTNPVTQYQYFQAYEGAMARTLSGGSPALAPSGNGGNFVNPWPDDDRKAGDLSAETFYVLPSVGSNPIRSYADGSATLRRRTGNDLYFNVSYGVNVYGWYTFFNAVSQSGTGNPPNIASLIVDLGTDFSLDVSPAGSDKFASRWFKAVRATAGTITQPDELGGASKPVQAVILPVNASIPADPAIGCDGSCVDLRPMDDVANLEPPLRVWQMPDVHTNINAGSVIMSGRGSLQVYSIDQPNAPRAPDTAGNGYSFDAFGASVSVQREPCDPGGADVLVVRGETRMSMPNVGGGSGSDAFVSAKFKLCSSSLRQASFQFKSPIGIPIGNSGLFATGLRGSVDIYADYTTIKFGLDFQAAQGGDGGIFKGSGDITIDTRGLFDFQGAGKLLGVLDATGHLWVAWDPLDTGFEMNISYGDWLSGFARAHLWEGQGWQHRYNWLPDNNEKHAAAEIGATVSIEQGAAFSWWFIDIPPWDIDFGIDIAFGQFCTNDSCTSYEWGVKGAFSVAGYDIGLYYGFDEGFDFILGNDDHILIDQYGGAGTRAPLLEGEATEGQKVRAAAPAVAGTSTETIPVSANAEQVIVAIGWQAGAPVLRLYEPGGAEVVSNTAHSVFISTTASSKLIGVRLNTPLPGNWHAVVSNLSANGVEHYQLVYFANKGAPGTPAERGHFIKPGSQPVDATSRYTITWQAPAGTPLSATIGLYYTRWISAYIPLPGGGWLWMWMPTTIDMPIVRNLPFIREIYYWDTSWMASGRYTLRAIVDDGVNDFPVKADNPADSCDARDELPSERSFASNRFPGLSTFSAAGWLLITDTVPPPQVTGLQLTGVDGAILARWDALPYSTTKDLSSYLVHWGMRMLSVPNGWHWVAGTEQYERVPATLTPTFRIGGLDLPFGLYRYGVTVSAIDASGNVGPASALAETVPNSAVAAQVPLSPLTPTLISTTSTSARLSWQRNPQGAAPASYRVVYRELVTFSTLLYTDTTGTAVTLAGLKTGHTYEASVMAANAGGWFSASSPDVRFKVTNGADGNHDSLPDDWENAYGIIHGPYIIVDPDGDGLSNALEYALGTSPVRQDTDGDGFSDWEEHTAGTDPLNGSSYPAAHGQPRLHLYNDDVAFHTKKGGVEQRSLDVLYANDGGGTLKLYASISRPWISAVIEGTAAPLADAPGASAPASGTGGGDRIIVSVDTSGLMPGYYTGTISLLHGAGGDALIGGRKCIRVTAWVSPPNTIPGLRWLFIPLVRR